MNHPHRAYILIKSDFPVRQRKGSFRWHAEDYKLLQQSAQPHRSPREPLALYPVHAFKGALPIHPANAATQPHPDRPGMRLPGSVRPPRSRR